MTAMSRKTRRQRRKARKERLLEKRALDAIERLKGWLPDPVNRLAVGVDFGAGPDSTGVVVQRIGDLTIIDEVQRSFDAARAADVIVSMRTADFAPEPEAPPRDEVQHRTWDGRGLVARLMERYR